MTAFFQLLLSIVVISSAGALPVPESDSRLDEKPDKTRKINAIQYFPHDGKSVNFGGARLKWTGPGDCSQREKMRPIIEVQGNGIKIRNAWIDEAPDGIHVNGRDVVIENIVFPKICEDAITANGGADNLIIRNCAFRGAKDKAIQLNAGKNILIENCAFEDCAKPIRVKKGVTVTIRNSVSRKSKWFVLADGEGAVVTVEGNRVDDSKRFVEADDGAKIILRDNRVSRIEKDDKAKDGGKIEGSE